MINFIKNIKENFDPQDLNWADEAQLTPIEVLPNDDDALLVLVSDLTNKIFSQKKRYKDYSVYKDNIDGVVYWYGLPGDYIAMATPAWDKPFEIPVDVTWDGGNNYDNIGIIKTPKFQYVEELIKWYNEDYFEKVSKLLEDFINYGDTPGIVESFYGTNNKKKFISENLESESNDVLLDRHKNYKGKVLVQKSLDDSNWTIKARRGAEAGVVLGYDKTVYLENVTFVIDNNLMESVEDIYAGVVGTIVESNISNTKDWIPVTYNPYTSKTFVRSDNNEPIFRAKRAILKNEKEIYIKSDDLFWADEIDTMDFSFQGKEYMFDIRELDKNQLQKLYTILKPHINKTNVFINHMGEEVSWFNDECFLKMLENGRGNKKSISLHCGIDDNDFIPLKGVICCITGTYEDEPNKSNIIPYNALDVIGERNNLNESEWFEDIANEPIMLRLDELEVGDIVIPTCLKEEEYIVTNTGTTIKSLDEPTQWFTLKRNTVKPTGGVYYAWPSAEIYFEHDTEIARNCRFKLIHREENLDLVENKKVEKTLLTEGRYDAITRRVVKDIIRLVTNKSKGSFTLPTDISDDFDYEQEGLSFSVDLEIKKTKKIDDFFVNAAVSDDKDENVILVSLFFGPNFTPKSYESLFFRLQEVMRHEIEHLTQGGPNRISDRPRYYGSTSDLKTTYGHHKNKIEVPALVHGFYRRAKLEKRPLDEVMIEDLDSDIQKGLLTKKQAENLLTMWLSYAKEKLPKAIYSKN